MHYREVECTACETVRCEWDRRSEGIIVWPTHQDSQHLQPWLINHYE